MSPDPESDGVVSPLQSGVTLRRGVLAVVALASVVLASIFSSPAVAQEAPVPEDSEERVTLVVRGMSKSPSGAT